MTDAVKTTPSIPARTEWIFRTKETGKNFQITLKERSDDIDGKPQQGITLRPVNQILRIRDKHIAELLLNPVCMMSNKLILLPQPEVISGNAGK